MHAHSAGPDSPAPNSLERLAAATPEALVALEQHLGPIAELPSCEAVFVADRHGKVLAASRRFKEIFFPQGAGLHLGGPGAFAPVGDQDLLRATDDIILNGLTDRVEFRHAFDSPQRGTIKLSTVKMPLVDSNGRITGVVGISRPVIESASLVEGLTDEQVKEKVERIAAMGDKEVQMLRMICCGCSNKEIAHAVAAPLRTVENRRRRIMIGLGVQSLADLVKLVIRLQDAGQIDLQI